ncbi:MAG: T9SS type A sorting domain-containing protein [Ferruginibacter sp.]
MKRNFTQVLLFVCILTATGINTFAQTSTLLNFTATPQRLSGSNNAVNSTYRIANVKTGMDAIVTIVSATGGASVRILDDNNTAKPEAFSPNIRIPRNVTGLIQFKIELVNAGTLIQHMVDSLYATAIDIDGSSNLHEIDAVDMYGGTSSYLAANPQISLAQNGTKFTGTNVAGIEYAGIDTTAKEIMFTVKHKNVSEFLYSCGASNSSNSSTDRQKSLYFKDFVYPPGGPLPVKYLSFDAVVNDKTVVLNWITAEELNHNYFEVERSFDMNTYNSIGLVLDGFNINGTGKKYQFKDNSPELTGRSIAYYRLKQFDIDGKVTYSKVLAVRLQAKADVVMQVSPNPFTENLNVRFTSGESGTAQIRIVNSTGQTMLSKQALISKGYNNIQVEGLSGLATGMYVAQLIMNGTIIDNQRVIKNAF